MLVQSLAALVPTVRLLLLLLAPLVLLLVLIMFLPVVLLLLLVHFRPAVLFLLVVLLLLLVVLLLLLLVLLLALLRLPDGSSSWKCLQLAKPCQSHCQCDLSRASSKGTTSGHCPHHGRTTRDFASGGGSPQKSRLRRPFQHALAARSRPQRGIPQSGGLCGVHALVSGDLGTA